MKVIRLFCVVAAVLAATSVVAGGDFEARPEFDLRVRQEVLDGVYHFAPESDRNWLRVRTRAGGSATVGDHGFKLLLTNEHRHYFTPDDIDFDWDELILDQAWWDWAVANDHRLTVGRQNIIWSRGFLILEGHPLDGSRSIYHHALRYRWSGLDVAVIHNPKYDPIVIAGDENRPLTDADETAVAVRYNRGPGTWSLIWKDEVDPDEALPDRRALTIAARTDRPIGEDGDWMLEVAVQVPDLSGDDQQLGDVFVFAMQGHAEFPLGRSWEGKLGFFSYGGDEPGGKWAFRAPWGRWPKWSELYIYTLIGESTPVGQIPPDRVHVAAWENVHAPYLEFTRPFGDRYSLRLNATWLAAREPDWATRGLLTQVEFKVEIYEGFKGHLLWEMLDPGSFHDGRYGLPPLTDTVHFLRWQLAYALP